MRRFWALMDWISRECLLETMGRLNHKLRVCVCKATDGITSPIHTRFSSFLPFFLPSFLPSFLSSFLSFFLSFPNPGPISPHPFSLSHSPFHRFVNSLIASPSANISHFPHSLFLSFSFIHTFHRHNQLVCYNNHNKTTEKINSIRDRKENITSSF